MERKTGEEDWKIDVKPKMCREEVRDGGERGEEKNMKQRGASVSAGTLG